MAGSHNYWLVVLSIVVATLASFVALELAAAVAPKRPRPGRVFWIALGAVTIGSGIWAMHFIGMLGFMLPTPVSYDVVITVLSLLIAVGASAAGLVLAYRGARGTLWLAGGGILIGFAIAGMHYTGMAAMRMEPPIRYAPSLLILSVLIAIAAGTVSLWSAFRLRMETLLSAFWKKAGSAAVMGVAIYGMHYTGMVAAEFAPGSVSTAAAQEFDRAALAALLGAFTLVFLMATLLLSAFEAYRASGEVGQLSRRLVELQDAERRALAAELHDVVGQNLSALNAELAMIRQRLPAEPAAVAARLAEASSLVKRSVEAIRSVMTRLRPPGADELGLPAALRWHASALEARTGIAVTVSADESLPRPSARTQDAVLRIYLEALNNALKHAGARQIRVSLEGADDQVRLGIEDDGRGFDASAPLRREADSGWGMMIMQERAAALGAELRVDSAPGSGTRVVFTLSKDQWS